ncbi:MAG: EAL domain-containing protein [Gammaproteobacteria bacterium]
MDSNPYVAQHDNQQTTRLILAGLGVTLLYVLSAELGLQLAVVHNNVTAVWPPSGIALAALLMFGLRLLPFITLGAFTVNVMADLSVIGSLGIATGNTLAAVSGALLVQKLARPGNPLDSTRGLIVLVVAGGLLATMLSATVGTLTLLETAPASRPDFAAIWITWWLGDAGGVLLLTPLLLTWKTLPQPDWSAVRLLEAACLSTGTLLIAHVVFGRQSSLAVNNYPLAFLPLIPLTWAALRFGKHGATACIALVATSALWGTIGGAGPFVRADMNESLLLLQSFVGTISITTLLLTAIFNEHRQARQLLGRHLQEKANSLGEILEQSLNEIYIFSKDSLRFMNVNQGARNNLGYTMEELHHLTPVDIKPEVTREAFLETLEPLLDGSSQRVQFETVHSRRDGTCYPVEVNLQLSAPGAEQAFVAIVLDISERHATRKKLDHMAHHDSLTDLPNRLLFSDRLTHALQHHRRNQRQLALLFLDLDGFKKINDSLGHPAGDDLLKQVAQRLLHTAREGDTVARLGGDEFTIILEDLGDPDSVPEVAQRLLATLARPFHVSGREVFLGASIGISMYPQDGHDVTSLMKHADVAMFDAKTDGGNKYRFYLVDMTTAANKRLTMETDLRHALERNEFLLHYQPQVSLETGRIVGLEALLRWRHPQHGMVPPDLFIPVAEDAGLIESLGAWVMHAACTQARRWQDAPETPLRMAINLSGHQINDRLIRTVSKILADTGLEPHCLELEITESCIMHNAVATIEKLGELRKLGVRLAIDDFGTGYSSMSYLKRFPLNKLKIDRSFVQDIPHDRNDAAIIKAILALGHTLNLTVIAEGVETNEQRAFLCDNGCDEMQGYLFSPPRPAAEIEQLLFTRPSLSLVR